MENENIPRKRIKLEEPEPKSETTLEKLKRTAPYNIFFTKIPKSPQTLTQSNSITFTDLLCPSLGQLTCSLQINFLVNFEWLMDQYKIKNLQDKPITVLYGRGDEKQQKDYKGPENLTKHYVQMYSMYAHHHSKLGIYVYEDNSVRVVVSTANLFYEDWNNYNQGLWISPRCPQLPTISEEAGESPTNFKKELLTYLRNYKLEILNPWIDYVKNADFSAIRVFLVTSFPGEHRPKSSGSHSLTVEELVSKHCHFSENENPGVWNIIAQASSIGSVKNSPDKWLNPLLDKISAFNNNGKVSTVQVNLSIIFPSAKNVKKGYFGDDSGKCLFAIKSLVKKQKWIVRYLHQWKADKLSRTGAMPHIKTYCRVSPCLKKLAWFLISSANFGQWAWGTKQKRDKTVTVGNYEVGVMFFPKFFDEDYFKIVSDSKSEQVFPFIYDLPLTKYGARDFPYCSQD